jgi:hypothetical protein
MRTAPSSSWHATGHSASTALPGGTATPVHASPPPLPPPHTHTHTPTPPPMHTHTNANMSTSGILHADLAIIIHPLGYGAPMTC